MSDTMLAKDLTPGMTLIHAGRPPATVIAVTRVAGPPERILVTVQSTRQYPLNMPVVVQR